MNCQGEWKCTTGGHIKPAEIFPVVAHFQSVNYLVSKRVRWFFLFFRTSSIILLTSHLFISMQKVKIFF